VKPAMHSEFGGSLVGPMVMGLILAGAVLAITQVSSATQRKLSAYANHSWHLVQETIGVSADDYVARKETFKAEKLLRTVKNRMSQNSLYVGEVHEKTFKLDEIYTADVKVEAFDRPVLAMKAAEKLAKEDQMSVGAPSAFEIQGLDNAGNYFIRSVSRVDRQVITLTLKRTLSAAEKKRIDSKNYEAMMNRYADTAIPKATALTRSQVEFSTQLQ
jgi:hypothetical protein